MSSMYPLRVEALAPFVFVMMRAGTNSRMIHHRTGVRTSTRKMAITMTTRRVSVRRERVGGWPIFRGLDLPNDLAVISVEVTRFLNQTIGEAVEDASALLGSSLAALGLAEQHGLWLVAAGAPIKRTDKVAAYRASRGKIWGVIERQGISIPAGSRSDLEIPLPDDSFILAGSVELELGELQTALRVTRLADAVCLATRSLTDPLPYLVPGLTQRVGAGESRMMVTLAQLYENWIFAARAFGQFDDPSVGVDIFAPDSFLDILEPIVAAEMGVNSDHDG
jgi:hypothetical protein